MNTEKKHETKILKKTNAPLIESERNESSDILCRSLLKSQLEFCPREDTSTASFCHVKHFLVSLSAKTCLSLSCERLSVSNTKYCLSFLIPRKENPLLALISKAFATNVGGFSIAYHQYLFLLVYLYFFLLESSHD